MRRAQLIGLAGIVVASGLWATPAAGQELRQDGNELLQNCGDAINASDAPTPLEHGRAMYCMGLVRGVWVMIQMYDEFNDGGGLCTPDGATVLQMARGVVNYLKDHPEQLHGDEVGLIFLALTEAFPCSP